MNRVKSSSQTRQKHTKYLKLVKGFRGRAKNCIRVAIEKAEKALQYGYVSRRLRKRSQNALWIQQLNSAFANISSMNYSTTIHKIKQNNIALNKKMLAELAYLEPDSFIAILNNIR